MTIIFLEIGVIKITYNELKFLKIISHSKLCSFNQLDLLDNINLVE